ncbi:hypothetical protein PWT90_09955 [Aphanocladium album]|nr:hypothetical protein PWT90_09955 [Aphanocladium album]
MCSSNPAKGVRIFWLSLGISHAGTHVMDVDVTKDTLLMIGKDQARRRLEPERGYLAGDDLGLFGFVADTASLEVKVARDGATRPVSKMVSEMLEYGDLREADRDATSRQPNHLLAGVFGR